MGDTIEKQLADQQPVDLRKQPPEQPKRPLNTYTFAGVGTLESNLSKGDVEQAIEYALKNGLVGSAAMDSPLGPMHHLKLEPTVVILQIPKENHGT